MCQVFLRPFFPHNFAELLSFWVSFPDSELWPIQIKLTNLQLSDWLDYFSVKGSHLKVIARMQHLGVSPSLHSNSAIFMLVLICSLWAQTRNITAEVMACEISSKKTALVADECT